MILQLQLTFVDSLQVKQAIPITIEGAPGEFISRFSEAGITYGGDTVEDAVESIRWLVGSSFTRLTELKLEQLGTRMRKQLAVLHDYVQFPVSE